MSALDKIRSFAEAASGNDVVIRDGITYGDAREVLAEVDRLKERIAKEDKIAIAKEKVKNKDLKHATLDELITWCEDLRDSLGLN